MLLSPTAKAAAPAAITDLACEPDVSEGSVWLLWTVPSGLGGSNAYEAKYTAGNIIYYDTLAQTYAQSWSSGTAGSRKREVVRGLNPGTEYAFAMKSNDGLGNWSAISNSVLCTAPAATKGDTIAPVTSLTYPVYNAVIPPGAVKVKGTVRDTGGSSVQWTEISFDNGASWARAKLVAEDGTNLLWEYDWRPAAGDYALKLRSADWRNNIEIPTLSIPIKVSTGGAPITPPPGDSETQLRLQIIELLRQIISILTLQLQMRGL